VHYYLNKDAFSKGIFAGLASYSGVETQFIGTESFVLTGDLRARRRIDNLIETQRRLFEQEVEANADIGAQELAIKFGITGVVAAPVAVAVAPAAAGVFSATTIGITETTLVGNIAAASLTGGVSLGAGEVASEALLGRSAGEVAEAGVKGFAIGAVTGAPFGVLAETGLTSAATARGAVPRSAARGGAGPVRTGQAGEAAAGITKNTTRIDSLSGAKNYRVPDGLDATTLTEVNNVAKLDFTTQLQDYLHYSLMTGRKFVLKVRPTTKISKPLQDAIDAGFIKLEYLP